MSILLKNISIRFFLFDCLIYINFKKSRREWQIVITNAKIPSSLHSMIYNVCEHKHDGQKSILQIRIQHDTSLYNYIKINKIPEFGLITVEHL